MAESAGVPERATKIGVVHAGRLILPALRPQQQLGHRVVVHQEGEVDPLQEPLHGPRLRLGGGACAPVGGVAGAEVGTLGVVAPVGVEVAVGVHAVVVGVDDAVLVVVAQVLAPHALVGLERVLVAVGVGHQDEPELAAVHEVGDVGIDAVLIHEVVHQPALDLEADPLAGVL